MIEVDLKKVVTNYDKLIVMQKTSNEVNEVVKQAFLWAKKEEK